MRTLLLFGLSRDSNQMRAEHYLILLDDNDNATGRDDDRLTCLGGQRSDRRSGIHFVYISSRIAIIIRNNNLTNIQYCIKVASR